MNVHRLPPKRRKSKKAPPANGPFINHWALGYAKVEIMLASIEKIGHTDLIADLRQIQTTRILTPEQKQAVLEEIHHRHALIAECNRVIENAKLRMKRATQRVYPERKAA